MATLERAILANAKDALRNGKLKMNDILEWSTSEATVKKNLRDGEIALHLLDPGVWLSVARDNDKRTMSPNAEVSDRAGDGARS